jgi:hypothetical protein
MELACLPTQYMRTKQTGQVIIDCPYWLPAGGRTAEKFISLVHGSPIGRLWSHPSQDKGAIRKVLTQRDLTPYVYDPVVLGVKFLKEYAITFEAPASNQYLVYKQQLDEV